MNTITFYKKISDNGISFYNPLSTTRKILGITFIAVAIMPNGLFIPALTLSCLCFGLKYNELKENIFNLSLRYKYKLGLK